MAAPVLPRQMFSDISSVHALLKLDCIFIKNLMCLYKTHNALPTVSACLDEEAFYERSLIYKRTHMQASEVSTSSENGRSWSISLETCIMIIWVRMEKLRFSSYFWYIML